MSSNDKTVIIADDHETLVMYLSILIRRMGYTVIPARNGEDVLNVLETIRPDLIITDLKMPIIDGLKTLKIMKKDPRFSDIPVIIVSAHFDQKAHAECLALGGNGFLTKPINIHDLHHILRECITFSNQKKRRNLRVNYNAKVTVIHEGLEQVYYAVSLSEQGIYLRSQNPLPVGTELQVHLPMKDGEILKTRGKVIYQKSLANDINKVDPGMAIQFDSLDKQSNATLKDFITEVLAGDLVEEQQEQVITTPGMRPQAIQGKLNDLKQDWRLS